MTWDPYLDLDSGVLRNRLAITDRSELAQVEAELSGTRLVDLAGTDLAGHYDLAHLRAFHRHLFGDVYDWAGELRTVAIGKGAPFCSPQELPSAGERLFVQLARHHCLQGLDRDTFVDALAWLLGGINGLHPFREGNGRTQRAFLGQLARTAGHPVRWVAMDPAENAAACRAAHVDGDTAPLRAMLDALVDR
ncbi:Fic family protein [Pseudonocardia sp. KRD-184]|uniref:protein adenylyltransferase n=1 Tax=Pseudonocardia oceani TaxID=2792013 RepID=A0ABS6UIP8_9PSEU|nr:Fic family protein [Pseudonocardia oceani]MBW0092439.1 Fic family protein [Pseudonocardia oceani]MBW0098685.1 Fic family protein [Pseudonocardia oceani]MBW0111971.1 Fic family protein [Pseudonocardia oceani]MBW0124244.1 Fic family protein [Pseudonocardia oceani]MBW0132099.1 Fic family protein [Pseudonocardia oceani]